MLYLDYLDLQSSTTLTPNSLRQHSRTVTFYRHLYGVIHCVRKKASHSMFDFGTFSYKSPGERVLKTFAKLLSNVKWLTFFGMQCT